jgi:hypothetical protein
MDTINSSDSAVSSVSITMLTFSKKEKEKRKHLYVIIILTRASCFSIHFPVRSVHIHKNADLKNVP